MARLTRSSLSLLVPALGLAAVLALGGCWTEEAPPSADGTTPGVDLDGDGVADGDDADDADDADGADDADDADGTATGGAAGGDVASGGGPDADADADADASAGGRDTTSGSAAAGSTTSGSTARTTGSTTSGGNRGSGRASSSGSRTSGSTASGGNRTSSGSRTSGGASSGSTSGGNRSASSGSGSTSGGNRSASSGSGSTSGGNRSASSDSGSTAGGNRTGGSGSGSADSLAAAAGDSDTTARTRTSGGNRTSGGASADGSTASDGNRTSGSGAGSDSDDAVTMAMDMPAVDASAWEAAPGVQRFSGEDWQSLREERVLTVMNEPGPGTDPSCYPRDMLPIAQKGKLTKDQVTCVQKSLSKAEYDADRARLSLVLITNAHARQETSDWEWLVARHLDVIDPENPGLSYRYSLHLYEKGPEQYGEALRWANVALGQRAAWTGPVYHERVTRLYKLRAAIAQSTWRSAEDSWKAEQTEEARDEVLEWRDTTRKYALEWYRYADETQMDTSVAYTLCANASISDGCEGVDEPPS